MSSTQLNNNETKFVEVFTIAYLEKNLDGSKNLDGCYTFDRSALAEHMKNFAPNAAKVDDYTNSALEMMQKNIFPKFTCSLTQDGLYAVRQKGSEEKKAEVPTKAQKAAPVPSSDSTSVAPTAASVPTVPVVQVAQTLTDNEFEVASSSLFEIVVLAMQEQFDTDVKLGKSHFTRYYPKLMGHSAGITYAEKLVNSLRMKGSIRAGKVLITYDEKSGSLFRASLVMGQEPSKTGFSEAEVIMFKDTIVQVCREMHGGQGNRSFITKGDFMRKLPQSMSNPAVVMRMMEYVSFEKLSFFYTGEPMVFYDITTDTEKAGFIIRRRISEGVIIVNGSIWKKIDLKDESVEFLSKEFSSGKTLTQKDLAAYFQQLAPSIDNVGVRKAFNTLCELNLAFIKENSFNVDYRENTKFE